MIKNAIVYTLTSMPDASINVLEAMEPHRFAPCLPTQPISTGWTAPREEHGALCESISGQLIFNVTTEVKKVPVDVLARKLAERCAEQERLFGRKPGKKESRELKDEILLDLLPAAFPARSAVTVWVNPMDKKVVVGTSSQKRADEAVLLLVNTFPGMAIAQLNTATSPSGAMTTWLTGQAAPESFGIDLCCELKGSDEAKTKIKYVGHNLDIEEIKAHIASGMMATSLDLTWRNRVSFTLTEAMTLKKIKLLDSLSETAEGSADAFDADVFLATTELAGLIGDLIQELGDQAPINQG